MYRNQLKNSARELDTMARGQRLDDEIDSWLREAI
jgi:hypothetical protein